MKEGACEYFIENRTFHVRSGDLVIIPAGVIHKTTYSDAPHTRCLLNFGEEYVTRELSASLSGVGYIYRNESIRADIEEIFDKIECEWNGGGELSHTALLCLTCELLLLIRRSKNEITDTEDGGTIQRALALIGAGYMNDISLASVAKELSVSSSHLSRLFKKETGFGFSEYLSLVRLKEAEQMICAEPGLKISEVAYSVGFNDSNYFSYKFKAHFGIAPKYMRKEDV